MLFRYRLAEKCNIFNYDSFFLFIDGWNIGLSGQRFEDCVQVGAEQEFQRIAKRILFDYKAADYRARNLPVPLKLGSYVIEADYCRVVSLGPKCTACELVNSGQQKISLKGVQKTVRTQKFTCDLFEDAVFMTMPVKARTYGIRRLKGQIFTIQGIKLALATPIMKSYLENDFLTCTVHKNL